MIQKDSSVYLPGTLVPRATKAMALTLSLRLTKQPRCPATSPIMAVSKPMDEMDATKARYPLYNAACKQNTRD